MNAFFLALIGLAVLIVSTVLSRRTGIAAPLLLVLLGLAASAWPAFPTIQLEPEWILAGVLPPLLYSSSVRLPVIDLRRNLGMVSWLSVVVVVASAVVIGGVVHWLVPTIALPVAIALGAVVSPTDAVAATAIGKRLGLPHRLMSVLEGESLLNDASALVTLRTAVAAVAGSFSLFAAVGSFVYAVVVAVVIGFVVGWLGVRVRARLDDPVLNTTVSFAVPFVAFVPAEHFGASGVVSVVIAGLVTGHSGAKRLSAADRHTEQTNWATITFVLENGVFALMGLQLMPLIEATEGAGQIGVGSVLRLSAVVLLLMVVLRFAGVWLALVIGNLDRDRVSKGERQLAELEARIDAAEANSTDDSAKIAWFRRRLERSRADLDFMTNEPISASGGLALAWSGMRGVVTLAAAQTIPEGTPNREAVILVAFVVAVASLVIFGGTLPWLIRRLAFEGPTPEAQRAEFQRLMQSLLLAAVDEVGPIEDVRIDGEPLDPEVAEQVATRFGPMLSGAARGEPAPSRGVREQGEAVQRIYLKALRNALLSERSIGAYSTSALTLAENLLDRQERVL